MIHSWIHISQKIKTHQERQDTSKIIKIKNMEDIFEEIHNEFINSEEFITYIKELNEYEEKIAFFSEKEVV